MVHIVKQRKLKLNNMMSAKGISVTMMDCGWDALLFCFFRLDIQNVGCKELTGVVTIIFVVVEII